MLLSGRVYVLHLEVPETFGRCRLIKVANADRLHPPVLGPAEPPAQPRGANFVRTGVRVAGDGDEAVEGVYPEGAERLRLLARCPGCNWVTPRPSASFWFEPATAAASSVRARSSERNGSMGGRLPARPRAVQRKVQAHSRLSRRDGGAEPSPTPSAPSLPAPPATSPPPPASHQPQGACRSGPST